MKRDITRLAVGGKCGGFGASGLAVSAAAPLRCSKSSAASQPKPMPADCRRRRRETSIDIDELAHVEDQETKARKRIPSQIVERGLALGSIRRPAESHFPTRLHLRIGAIARDLPDPG